MILSLTFKHKNKNKCSLVSPCGTRGQSRELQTTFNSKTQIKLTLLRVRTAAYRSAALGELQNSWRTMKRERSTYNFLIPTSCILCPVCAS